MYFTRIRGKVGLHRDSRIDLAVFKLCVRADWEALDDLATHLPSRDPCGTGGGFPE